MKIYHNITTICLRIPFCAKIEYQSLPCKQNIDIMTQYYYIQYSDLNRYSHVIKYKCLRKSRSKKNGQVRLLLVSKFTRKLTVNFNKIDLLSLSNIYSKKKYTVVSHSINPQRKNIVASDDK